MQHIGPAGVAAPQADRASEPAGEAGLGEVRQFGDDAWAAGAWCAGESPPAPVRPPPPVPAAGRSPSATERSRVPAPPAAPTGDSLSPAGQRVTQAARTLRDRGEHDAALACLDVATNESALTPVDLCEVALYRGKVLQAARRFAAAEDALQAACGASDALPPGPARDRSRAFAYFQRAMAADAAAGAPSPLPAAVASRFAAALPLMAAVAHSSVQAPCDRADMRLNEAHIAQRHGELPTAAIALRSAVTLQRLADHPKGLGYAHRRLGQCLAQQGLPAAAAAHLREAATILRAIGALAVADATDAELAQLLDRGARCTS